MIFTTIGEPPASDHYVSKNKDKKQNYFRRDLYFSGIDWPTLANINITLAISCHVVFVLPTKSFAWTLNTTYLSWVWKKKKKCFMHLGDTLHRAAVIPHLKLQLV